MASVWKASSKKQRAKRAHDKQAASFKADDGRVHLVLEVRAGARRVASGFTRPLFDEPWQDNLALATANATLRHLGETPALENTYELAQETLAALSKLAEGLAEQSPRKVACHAGCDHCCHQSVGVTGVEAVTIVNHLKTHLDSASLERLAKRVSEARKHTRGLSYAERHSPDLPCVFLDSNRGCSIYPVRPLVCRAVNSLDAEQCRANLREPEQRARYLATGQGADALLGPIRASHAMSAGVQLAGTDAFGLDMQPLDLVAAIDELLQDPTLAERWLSERTSLSRAAGSNATRNAQLRSVAGVRDAT